MITAAESCRAVLDRLVRVGTVLVACVGGAVIAGEFFDLPHIAESLPSLASMKVNTACGFVAATMSLWLLHTYAASSAWIRLARSLAVVVIAMGALTLAQDLFGIEFGIDQVFLVDAVPADAMNPGRMSPGAASNLVLIGLALLVLKARRPKIAVWAHWLVVPPLLVATLATIGYAYGVSALYTVKPYTTMAAHTAVSFLVLGLCVLAADSAYGFANIATSDTAGGIVSRRLLPTLPGILFVLGWLRLQGQIVGLYDTRFGIALMVLFSITVCIVAVASTANTLHAVDRTRKTAEAEILSLNAGLELRVLERTRELAQVSAQLSLVNTSLERLSRHDGLTSLANRRFFDSYLADQISTARRHKRALALVLVDVDAFKAYNDHYGHQAGDDCLKQVAAALKACCRRTADMAARYGGEEFAMILPDTDLDAALQIAEAARVAVGNLYIEHAKSPTESHVSISGGVAMLPLTGTSSAARLVADADRNLYQAKHLGRNRMIAVEAAVA